MSSSSPSSSPPPPSNPTLISTKKPQPLPWTHHETIHLIQVYQEKWFSLRRGQLKASQWEEVAVIVAARCGYDNSYPAKSAVQCRHKMEKLRRRYREEQRRISLGGACSWQYFDVMDNLGSGPNPISARPLAMLPFRQSDHAINGIRDEYRNNEDDEDEKEEGEGEEEGGEAAAYGYRSKSRSINYILRKPTIVNRFAGSDSGYLQAAVEKRNREEMEDDDHGWKAVELGLAVEIKAFAERMWRVEKKKMEMMKEAERCRMGMENKRMEMILDSQKKIVDMIGTAFGSRKQPF